MNQISAYLPPSSKRMAEAQNEEAALRLLLAQRRLYSIAKRWAYLRYVGLSIIALVAPILSATWSEAAVVVGAVAAGWIFAARTVFARAERYYAARAATVQESFDHYVYGMPDPPPRVPAVSPEEIDNVVGDAGRFQAAIDKEALVDWYPVDLELPGAATVAIAQRANAKYTEHLLVLNSRIWLAATVGWSVIAVAVSWSLSFTLERFLLGVALPLLPALLDVYEQWTLTRRAGAERRAVAEAVETELRGGKVNPSSLIAWQVQLYQLRKESPQVPNLVYKRARVRNERAMHAGALAMAVLARNSNVVDGEA